MKKTAHMRMVIKDEWHFWNGFHEFDEYGGTMDYQLIEGIKERRVGWLWEYEKGNFGFIKELKKWELIEGKKKLGEKKISGKWKFCRKKGGMKKVKCVHFCGDGKCLRNAKDYPKISFKVCGKCDKIRYCSRKHQKRDWEYHKFSCCFY